MNTFTKTLALFSLVGLFAVGATAHAQTDAAAPVSATSSSTPATAVTVATVNIYNARIVTQSDNTVTLSFDLSNRENIQPDIQYAVDLIQQGVNGQSIIDEHVYAEVVSLGENQTVSRQIDYTAPSYLAGEYQIWLVAKNHNGMMLALANPGEVTLKGDNQYVEIKPQSCYLQVAGEPKDKMYAPDQGVDIKPEETLTATCEVVNHAASTMAVTPKFSVYQRSTFGEEVNAGSAEQAAVHFKAQEKKEITLTVPHVQAPQAYDAMLILQDAKGGTISNKVVFHYVVRGLSATIQNLRLDKDYYQKGDTAEVSFFWSPSADNFPGSRLGATDNGDMSVAITVKNAAGETCGELSQRLDQSVLTPTFALPIAADCLNPNVSVSIQDGKGDTLDQKSFAITSQQVPTARPDYLKYLLLAGVVVLLVGALVVVAIKIKRKKALTIAMLFIAGSGFFAVGVPAAKADTFLVGDTGLNTSWSSSGNHAIYSVSLDKTTYSPGGRIIAYGAGGSLWCGNTFGTIALKATINGSTKQLFEKSGSGYLDVGNALFPMFGTVTQVFAAPSSGGGYNAVFAACDGFESDCRASHYRNYSMPYTVYPTTCTLPWGGTLQSGSSVTAYQSSSVMAPANCQAQTRTCTDGTLSGSYAYSSCAVVASATLTAQPTTIIAGASATLSWDSHLTKSCVIDNSVTTGGTTSGSVSVTPVTTTTYTLSCTPTDGSAAVTSSATVTVNSSGLACTQTGGNFTATPGKDPYHWTVDGVSSSVTTNSVPIPTIGGSHSASVSAGGSVANCPLITVASQSQGQGNGGTGGGSGSTDGCVIQPTGTLTASPNRVSSVATPIKLSWSVQGYNTLDSFVKTGKCEIDKNGKMLINLKDASVDSCNASGTYTDVAGVSNQTVYTLYCQGVGSALGSFIVNVMPKFNEF